VRPFRVSNVTVHRDHGAMGKAVDVRITGMVQGVSFRAYTRQQAHGLGVAGWVRNEPDGSVAGHFEGPERAVDALVAWCRHGPAYAEVDEVAVSDAELTGATDFDVRAV
jgi:acylphosphatase